MKLEIIHHTETTFSNRYAKVAIDGVVYHVAIERDRPVRIPYKPRGANRGWTWRGTVRDARGKSIWTDRVARSQGIRGALRKAGVYSEEPTNVQ